VELGAGNAEKTRVVLDAMRSGGSGGTYVPVDVSHDFLQTSASQLRREYPELDVRPVVADMTSHFSLPTDLPGPRWIAFLGSTLGNFDTDASVGLLRRIRRRLGDQDRFLLGVDLRPGPHKSVERIELAYNDPYGVTAAFSLNVLAVLNAEVHADFDLTGFRHHSFYNESEGRIETYLDSLRDQVVGFPDGTVITFRAGESVRTEISCKYDRPTIEDLFARAALDVDRWVEDRCGYYALVLGTLAA
jgi:L-histidine N-alpha-methyltransferase